MCGIKIFHGGKTDENRDVCLPRIVSETESVNPPADSVYLFQPHIVTTKQITEWNDKPEPDAK